MLPGHFPIFDLEGLVMLTVLDSGQPCFLPRNEVLPLPSRSVLYASLLLEKRQELLPRSQHTQTLE